MKTGVMVCGHGSRSQSAVDEFATLAQKLPAYLPDDWMCDYGYLEFANPVIRDGLDNLREAGCDRIRFFLLLYITKDHTLYIYVLLIFDY